MWLGGVDTRDVTIIDYLYICAKSSKASSWVLFVSRNKANYCDNEEKFQQISRLLGKQWILHKIKHSSHSFRWKRLQELNLDFALFCLETKLQNGFECFSNLSRKLWNTRTVKRNKTKLTLLKATKKFGSAFYSSLVDLPESSGLPYLSLAVHPCNYSPTTPTYLKNKSGFFYRSLHTNDKKPKQGSLRLSFYSSVTSCNIQGMRLNSSRGTESPTPVCKNWSITGKNLPLILSEVNV